MTRPPTLLVLTPSTGGYFFGELLGGIADVLAPVGGRLVVVQTLELGMRSDDLGDPPAFALPVAWDHVDGAIAVTSAVQDGYLTALATAGIPVVTASSRRRDVALPGALPDSAGGTWQAVEHLISHGHTRIGFIGNLRQTDIYDRYEAYQATLADHGLRDRASDLFSISSNGESGGVAAGEEFLALENRPTAVMAATDRNAIGFLATLQAAGIAVPDEVALVSFDDIESAAFTSPPLTTVSQPFTDVGALAARLVMAQIAGDDLPAKEHRTVGRLITRESCGCTPTGSGAATTEPRQPRRVEAALSDAAAILAAQLGSRAGSDQAAAQAGASRLIDDVTSLDLRDDASSAETARLVTATLTGWDISPHAVRRAARHLQAVVGGREPGPGAQLLLTALGHLQGRTFLADTTQVEREFDEQFAVETALLGASSDDPRRLAWLAETRVRRGVLALWDDEVGGPMTVVGVHDTIGGLGVPTGAATSVRAFPPSTLLDGAAAADGEVCVVVPVRTRRHEWGLLAVTDAINLTSARETYHHWATLLGATLDQLALQEAVGTSERRYAAAARATNEGLWEWRLGTHDVYLSDHCRSLVGLHDGAVGPRDALAAIEPEDRPGVREALEAAMACPDVAAEVDFRVVRGGRPRWMQLRGLGLADGSGTVHTLVGSVRDIDTRKQLEGQLRQAALFDAITGLPNRRMFLDRLQVALEQRRRHPERRFAVIFLDLDGFKLVNDSLGHLQGDQLLKVIGHRLRDEVRSVDTAARFGGDEFAILLAEPTMDELPTIARRLQARIAEPVLLGTDEVSVTASVGITTSDAPDADAEAVLRDADIAMYSAKEAERGSAALFDPAMHGRADDRLRLRAELRTALDVEQFAVHYQPIVALDGSGLTRFEALVRWNHPTRGHLLPGDFLPALEDGPGIVALGAWVLDTVCAQIARWYDVHHETATVAVNLSHREFWSSALPSVVEQALRRHQIPGENLVLEITETVVMTDAHAARERMDQLRDLGVRLHIDDFGTGTSSLNALRSFPVDALKIDGSFVRELQRDPQTARLVAVIIEMGRALGIGVVAECVETSGQEAQLREMGCADVQGWLYAKALPGDEAGALLGQALGRPAAPHDEARRTLLPRP